MRRALRHIASALLAVLLATVLAPSFSWEASANQGSHDQDVLALGGAQDHDGHGAAGHDDSLSHHHDGCAGHMFGHLFVTLDEAVSLVLLDADDATVPERLHGVLTSFPKRLDRPPLVPPLA